MTTSSSSGIASAMTGLRVGRGKADCPSRIRFHIQTQMKPITRVKRDRRRWRDRSRDRATSAVAPRKTRFCFKD